MRARFATKIYQLSKATIQTLIKMSFTTTTRLTSPAPTGAAKWKQDEWDVRRDAQVRSCMKVTNREAIASYAASIVKAIKHLSAAAKEATDSKPIVVTVYGSYELTDSPEVAEDADEMQTEFGKWFYRQGHDANEPLSKLREKHNVNAIDMGVRTTGTFHFSDGTMHVADPTKPTPLAHGKRLTAIKRVKTYYMLFAINI